MNFILLIFCLEKFPEAEIALRKLLELKPDNGNAWFLLGSCLVQTDRPEEAVPALQKSVECFGMKRRAQAMHLLGKALIMLGRKEEGEEHIYKAKIEDPSLPDE